MIPPQQRKTPALPFFVYGTLRSGESNHFTFGKTIIRVRDAVLSGADLWNLGPYPMATPGKGEIISEVVEVDQEHYDHVLRALDRLEGVNAREPEKPGGLFYRAQCKILSEGVFTLTWVYFGREDLALRGKIIRSGDWKNRK